MFRLTKSFRFEASHQLMNHDGKCARLHGHSWVGSVVCEGYRLNLEGPKTGMLIDYGDISKAVEPYVEKLLDHWHLNESLQTEAPTSEFIACWLYGKLKADLPNLAAVIIEETCTSRCEYRP